MYCRNTSKEEIINTYRQLQVVVSKGNSQFMEDKISNIAFIITKLPSLITFTNLRRIFTYLRLFGFKITVKEVKKKLSRDHYYLYEGVKSNALAKNSERLKYHSNNFEDTTISVVIPVKNAGHDFQDLLSMIKKQKGFKDIEIIVVDSGSTDNSIKIAKGYGAKIIQILPEEFSHSFSRNIGAKQACGDYILFTVQDALPPTDSWLQKLCGVMLNNNVVAVSCAETPKEDADLFYKALSWNHNKFMDIDNQDRIMIKPEIENYVAYKKNGQLNNVACLISKDVFMNYGFRGQYAEDLDLGIRLIRDEHKLAIIGSAKIIHSHKRPPYHYLKRGYTEHLHYSKLLPNFPVFAVKLEQLASEIRRNYILLNQIVNVDLKEIEVPIAIKYLSRFVMKRLHHFIQDGNPDTIDLNGDEYMDSKFRAFLNCLNMQKISTHLNNEFSDGIILENMQSYTALILEYMDNLGNSIDHQSLEDLKHGLFAAYAFIIGTQLASSFLRYSEINNHFNKEIYRELTNQI
jgi:glycosyltransferase involved in cell wall biosynthesis